MDKSRRDVLAAGAAAAGAALMMNGNAALAADLSPSPLLKVNRVYAASDGASRMEVINLKPLTESLPVLSVSVMAFKKGAIEDWHVSPAKFMVIVTAGIYQIELTDGSRVDFGPGEVTYFENLTGKGHYNRTLSDGVVMAMRLADDFDVSALKA